MPGASTLFEGCSQRCPASPEGCCERLAAKFPAPWFRRGIHVRGIAVQRFVRKIEDHDINGSTALHWAAYHGHNEVVELLLTKNAQIEAPGTKFVPGTLYTIKIEHGGGMRIDAEPLAPILKGERIPS